MKQNKRIILVYYKFRGQLQPIRNLLCYLQLPFIQVHPQLFEEEKINLSSDILQQLKLAKVDKNRLPLLIFQQYNVYQSYPILSFICHRFQRDDLLGSNPQQKARLEQLLEIYFMKQPQSMNELSRLSDLAIVTSAQQMKIQLRKSYENLMNRSGYIRQMCDLLDYQLNPKYILNNKISILDFLFLQTCNYTLGVFNFCDQFQYQIQQKLIENKYPFSLIDEGQKKGKKPNLYYLKIFRQYRARIQNHNFYQKYKPLLESYSIFSYFTSVDRISGLKKIWQLDDFFIK